MYFGPPEAAVEWFSQLDYRYEQWRDGAVSDWLIDLVSVGFLKPEVLPSHCNDCVHAYGRSSGWFSTASTSHTSMPECSLNVCMIVLHLPGVRPHDDMG